MMRNFKNRGKIGRYHEAYQFNDGEIGTTRGWLKKREVPCNEIRYEGNFLHKSIMVSNSIYIRFV